VIQAESDPASADAGSVLACLIGFSNKRGGTDVIQAESDPSDPWRLVSPISPTSAAAPRLANVRNSDKPNKRDGTSVIQTKPTLPIYRKGRFPNARKPDKPKRDGANANARKSRMRTLANLLSDGANVLSLETFHIH
jgi:hypothetical protein